MANGRTRRITDAAGGAYDPYWSPDGEWIAYVARDGTRHDVWLVRPDGRETSGCYLVGTKSNARLVARQPLGGVPQLERQGFDVRVIGVPGEGEIEPVKAASLSAARRSKAPPG